MKSLKRRVYERIRENYKKRDDVLDRLFPPQVKTPAVAADNASKNAADSATTNTADNADKPVADNSDNAVKPVADNPDNTAKPVADNPATNTADTFRTAVAAVSGDAEKVLSDGGSVNRPDSYNTDADFDPKTQNDTHNTNSSAVPPAADAAFLKDGKTAAEIERIIAEEVKKRVETALAAHFKAAETAPRYAPVTLRGGGGMPLAPVKRPRTLADAGKITESLFGGT
jgi:hypothetical protein